MPPLREERIVMYTGFRLPAAGGSRPDGGASIAELRERAPLLASQPPSPLATASLERRR